AGRVGDRFADVLLARGEVTITVSREELPESLAWLRDEADLAFTFLSDVSCTDWPGRDPRIWMAYHLHSLEHGHRIRVKAGLPEDDLRVGSLTPMFPAADWHEREVYDLFGVVFEGHPDLRRILLPDEWEGHPLRKDQPLGGVVTRYKGATIPPPDERGL
ncbi:MAG TPA: NADH-quinone oxidoreductase subunit C, partial [Actinomycetota bacterium]|nr:NADH-quinone oxidoreductase subunit C [Actinomycetota bacterium]